VEKLRCAVLGFSVKKSNIHNSFLLFYNLKILFAIVMDVVHYYHDIFCTI